MSAPFYGGIHPYDGKILSRSLPLTTLPAPAHVILPLVQHIGQPCTPCVSVGDAVTVIGTSGDFCFVQTGDSSVGCLLGSELK